MRECKLKTFVLILILLLTFSTNSFAFEGKRKGFIIGLGFGKSDLKYNLKQNNLPEYYEFGYERRVSDLNNLASNFVIGYGLNNKLLIKWTSKVSWFSQERPIFSSRDEKDLEPTLYLSGVAGIGVSYYFKDKSPSPFITNILGYSNIGDFEKGKNRFGFGFSWGVGYEFAPHWNLKLDFCHGFPNQDNSDELSFKNIYTFMLTLNILGY